jgi:hypothetical protein
MKRGVGDALLSLAALVTLIVVLVSFDERVRDYAWRFTSTTTIAEARSGLRDVGSVMVDAVREQTLDHAPMTIFVVAGGMLFLFMVRS